MKLNIIKPFLPSIDEIYQDFSKCLSTGMVTNNCENVLKFEKELQDFFKSKNKPLVFCNGEMALHTLIQAWKIKLGFNQYDSFKVLVPSFTFAGTINAIVANNLEPVFCDVDETLTIDINKCEIISNDIKMIIPVSAYGNLTNFDKIKEFARTNNLAVIFDNAPAFGSKYDKKFTCNHDFDVIYSLHASKIFNSMEGGIAISNHEDINNIMLELRDFGQFEKKRGNINSPGLNSKMQEISAIVGLKNLEKIEYILDNRIANIDKYRNFFSFLEEKGLLKTMKVRENVFCPYLYFPIILNSDCTDFVEYMNNNNIAVRRYYTAVDSLNYYSNKFERLDLSFTYDIKDKIVSLPLYTIMSEEEINYLFETVKNYFLK